MRQDLLTCPVTANHVICSVCCSAHATCHDVCKTGPSTFRIAEREIRERFIRRDAKSTEREPVPQPGG
jgi:hypothetical protein